MISLDPVARELERVERTAFAARGCGIKLGRGYAQTGLVQIDTVEFLLRTSAMMARTA